MHIKIIDEIDTQPLLDLYNKIESQVVWSEYPNGKQSGLQYRTEQDPWKDAVGRWKPSKFSWSDNELNPFFKGTTFENIIIKYNLKRTRFMWMKPMCCYSMHQDFSPRIHIPLVTNPDCYFVFKETGLTHMKTGNVYLADTRQHHTAMNCSNEWRLHLVGEVL